MTSNGAIFTALTVELHSNDVKYQYMSVLQAKIKEQELLFSLTFSKRAVVTQSFSCPESNNSHRQPSFKSIQKIWTHNSLFAFLSLLLSPQRRCCSLRKQHQAQRTQRPGAVFSESPLVRGKLSGCGRLRRTEYNKESELHCYKTTSRRLMISSKNICGRVSLLKMAPNVIFTNLRSFYSKLLLRWNQQELNGERLSPECGIIKCLFFLISFIKNFIHLSGLLLVL